MTLVSQIWIDDTMSSWPSTFTPPTRARTSRTSEAMFAALMTPSIRIASIRVTCSSSWWRRLVTLRTTSSTASPPGITQNGPRISLSGRVM